MIPTWKKWLSYLTEVHIESAPSDINPHLYVSMEKGKLQLCTENAIYSFDENYHNFAEAFSKIDTNKVVDQEVLILGFGLGSIPLILQNTFGLKAHYTGIELDENVLYLFDQYRSEKIHSNLQLICADAQIFAATCQQKFQLICSDIFLDNEIPDTFWSLEYLEDVKNMLQEGGAVMMNTLALTEGQQAQSSTYFEQIFKQVFPEAIKLAVHRNYILLSDKAWLK